MAIGPRVGYPGTDCGAAYGSAVGLIPTNSAALATARGSTFFELKGSIDLLGSGKVSRWYARPPSTVNQPHDTGRLTPPFPMFSAVIGTGTRSRTSPRRRASPPRRP